VEAAREVETERAIMPDVGVFSLVYLFIYLFIRFFLDFRFFVFHLGATAGSDAGRSG
jgi:hypothetical protein